MPCSTVRRRSGRLLAALASLLSFFALVAAASPDARAQSVSGWIAAPNRVDVAYDTIRQVVYISNGPALVRYSLGQQAALPPLQVGGDLAGMDISPDGSLLAVADRKMYAGYNRIVLVDLATGAVREQQFALDYYEGGTFTVAFGSDGRLLVTSRFNGSGWVPLRRYDPATGAVTVLTEICQDTMLAPSADGSVIGFAESNISDGRFGRYRVSDGNILRRQWYDSTSGGTGWFNYEMAANRDGTQYAIPVYGGTFIYNADLLKTATVGHYVEPQPIGAAYHPREDLVYFAWVHTSQVRAHRTTDFSVVASYDMGYVFRSNGNWAFTSGRLKVARDGSYLFGTVGDPGTASAGVKWHRLPGDGPTITVNAPDLQVNTGEDSPVAVTLSATVSNGGTPSYQVVRAPLHGKLTGEAPNLVYTPDADYNGTDVFTYRASYPYNGGTVSDIGVVNIQISPVNDAPRFTPGADQTVAEDAGPQTVSAWATGISAGPPDEAQQMLIWETATTDGALFARVPTVSADGTLAYTPAANGHGTARVQVRLKDGGGATTPWHTLTITVTSVNDAPVASSQSVVVTEDTPGSVMAAATDPDGDALTFAVVSGPTKGALSGVGPNWTYTPGPNAWGTDSFTFKANDGMTDSNAATVTITITAVNDAPDAIDDTATTTRDRAVVIPVLANDRDVDGDPLTVTALRQPANGSVVLLADGGVRYTPKRKYKGGDAFTYTVSDGKGGTDTATVRVTVNR